MSVDAVQTAWWGDGAPPTDRWPGVTIAIDECDGAYRFDAAKADRVCEWFPRFCSHSKGKAAGRRFDLLPYQRDLILRPLFGWVDQDGLRRFRKAYIEIPKKNGKTQLIAGLALYMLLGDGEPGAEVYVAAADRDQASILFGAAKAMVEANPYLKKRCISYRNEIRRADDPSAFFKVLSAEAATKHGPNIHCLIIDELHAQPDRELFETLTRGVIARRQPLILLITTAGDDDESICFEEYDYGKRVLSGAVLDRQHLPVIFEAAPNDDPYDPSVWARTNPALGQTVDVLSFSGFANEAKNEPRKRNDFLRYHLNRWVNQATAWIPVDWWDACQGEMPSDDELATWACAGGLDLAQKIDLAAFVVVFRQRTGTTQRVEAVATEGSVHAEAVVTKTLNLNYRIVIKPYFWIPEDTMRDHEKTDHVPYSQWVKDGLITPTDGVSIDYTRIYQDITQKILPRFPRLRAGTIGYDPAFATDLAEHLRKFTGRAEWCQEILQNYRYMSEPAYIFEALIKAGHVVHGGHRVLRNHVENVAVKRDEAMRLRPVRPKKASKHTDGVVGTLMGLRQLMAVPDRAGGVGMFVV